MSTPDPQPSGQPGKPVSAIRGAVSERSRGLLLRLSQLPSLVVPVAMLVLMLVGLSAPLYVAIPALGLVATFVIWLAYLSWPVLDTAGRLVRAVMVVAVAAAMIGRITGWL